MPCPCSAPRGRRSNNTTKRSIDVFNTPNAVELIDDTRYVVRDVARPSRRRFLMLGGFNSHSRDKIYMAARWRHM